MAPSGSGAPAPDWTRHVIWWHVYPLGFVGAEPELTGEPAEPHRLRRLIGWLDHLVVAGLQRPGARARSSPRGRTATTPSTTSRSTRGSGDDDDFDALVAACHERGIRVLLDGVFNHDGGGSPRVRAAFERGPGSTAGEWFRLRDADEGRVSAESSRATSQLVALNHDNPEVQDFVAEVMEHWLERGVDGWRLDAAYAVPAAFWAAVLPRVRARFPDAWFVGRDDPRRLRRLRRGVRPRLGHAVRAVEGDLVARCDDANLHELAWTLGRHAELLEHFVPLTFLGNHDVTRIASQVHRRAAPRARGRAAVLPARGAERLLRRRAGAARGQGGPGGRRRRGPARDAGRARTTCRTRVPRSPSCTAGCWVCAAGTRGWWTHGSRPPT